ncbi:MAG: hypothetical protein DRN99_00975 [Thermoproteota archaeon]|nr:MAG: hypothetical protein DRN99_00975 [Candidatus Korarchaeota archaeon]
MGKVTLIGKLQARVGWEFIFLGEATACKRCRLRAVCVESLQPERRYTIKNVKRRVFKCQLHGEVVAVEVEPSPLEVAMESRSVHEGAVTQFIEQNCGIACWNKSLCKPVGLPSGTKVKVESDLGEIDCPLGRNLRKCRVIPL